MRDRYALDATEASALGSNEDLNVLAVVPGAEPGAPARRLLVKVSHPGISRAALDAQNAALRWLAGDGSASGRLVPFAVPSPIRASGGDDVEQWPDGVRLARVLTFVEGSPPAATPRVAEGLAEALGRTAGRLVTALEGFAHPGLPDGGAWDLRDAADVVGYGGPHATALEQAAVRIAVLRPALGVQPIHGDLTADNVVLDGAGAVAGVIDFGDVGMGWRAAEAAICACALLQHDGDPLAEALAALAAFDKECPLDDAEVAALWPLVVTRAVVLVASAAEVLAQDPGNDYARARAPLERRMCERATSISLDDGELLVRAALGRLGVPPATVTPMTAGLDTAAEVDLSVTASVHDGGAFASETHARRVLARAAAAHGGAITRYGEHRLTAQALAGPGAPSLALSIEACVAAGTPVLAPAEGVAVVTGGASVGVRLAGGATAWARGVAPAVEAGQRVGAGDLIGHAVASDGAPTAFVSVGWCLAVGIEPPLVAGPAAERWWQIACPDPSALLGRPVPPTSKAPASAADLLVRRETVFAQVQEHYYAAPPQIERGWRHHLVDTRGRAYLDMVNNVAILGHGEPRLTQAVAAQMARLNTNSRFHYESVVEFSEALAAKAPEGLDVVLLVNSGSEAVDLAIRMARVATGRSDILALTEAYHGWTVGADAISTSIGDNPGALATRPEWVHLLDAPNTYRGRHRGADAGRYLDDALSRLADLDARGVALAGVVSEPIFGNGGGILLPDGYLAGLWAAVRARGGVCVSDEVQVSYGRLGEYFWGFEQQGVVPDVITVAKAMGNGHPLGAVITTRAIADAFAVEGSFFSSAGGSPVGSVVGSTVLRVLEEDGLQQNARVVGAQLAAGLRALADRYPVLGAVHGMGLYLGVEVVRGGPDQPDPATASAICEELLEEGVIVQPTGDHKNVLKIKPPLTIDAPAVARFLAALDGVLERRAARAAM